MISVTFNCSNVTMPDIDGQTVTRWLDAVVRAHGKVAGRLAYLFCNDEDILAANRQFLGHDYYTDIITWDYSNSKRVSGDMMISLDTVASNARLLNVDYRRELMRVIVHGVLHLCGINDKGPGEREVMERHEDAALAMLEAL